jgi:hypothetical protein
MPHNMADTIITSVADGATHGPHGDARLHLIYRPDSDDGPPPPPGTPTLTVLHTESKLIEAP